MWNVMMLVGIPCNRISKVMGCKVLQQRYHSASRTHRTVGRSDRAFCSIAHIRTKRYLKYNVQKGHTRTKLLCVGLFEEPGADVAVHTGVRVIESPTFHQRGSIRLV